jgi:hypothetical protein
MGGGHWHPVWEDPRSGARLVGPACDTFEAAYRAGRQSARAGPDGPEIPGPGAAQECRGGLCREALDSVS